MYEQPFVLNSDALVDALFQAMPIDVITKSDFIIAVAHPDQVGRFKEGNVASITNIFKSNGYWPGARSPEQS